MDNTWRIFCFFSKLRNFLSISSSFFYEEVNYDECYFPNGAFRKLFNDKMMYGTKLKNKNKNWFSSTKAYPNFITLFNNISSGNFISCFLRLLRPSILKLALSAALPLFHI